jgi:hypothetical protein
VLLPGAAGNIVVLGLLCEYLPANWVPQLSFLQLHLIAANLTGTSVFAAGASGSWSDSAGVQLVPQLSNGSMQWLLLWLFAQHAGMTGIGASVGPQDTDEARRSVVGAFILDVLRNLMSLPTAPDVVQLLQFSTSTGLLDATRGLLKFSQPSCSSSIACSEGPQGHLLGDGDTSDMTHEVQTRLGNLLDGANLHELLLRCAALDEQQLHGGFKRKVELCECLLAHAGWYDLDGEKVDRLVLAMNKGF